MCSTDENNGLLHAGQCVKCIWQCTDSIQWWTAGKHRNRSTFIRVPVMRIMTAAIPFTCHLSICTQLTKRKNNFVHRLCFQHFSHIILVSRITLYSIQYTLWHKLLRLPYFTATTQHRVQPTVWKSDYLGRWVVVVVTLCVFFGWCVCVWGGGGGVFFFFFFSWCPAAVVDSGGYTRNQGHWYSGDKTVPVKISQLS